MTPARIAEIRARCDAVAQREAESSGPGNRCYGGFEIRGAECTKCGATADDDCPVSISDGAEAIADRAALLASHDALQAEVERLREIERQAISEGCNIGSDHQAGAPVWLVNDRAIKAESTLTTARTDAAQRMRERCAKSFEDKATSLRQMFNNAYGSMWPFGHEAIVRSREDDAAAIRAIPLEEP